MKPCSNSSNLSFRVRGACVLWPRSDALQLSCIHSKCTGSMEFSWHWNQLHGTSAKTICTKPLFQVKGSHVGTVPTWEPFTWNNGFVQIVFAEVPCNWFQCQENSIDPVHFEWLHSNWTRVLQGDKGPRPPTHLKIGFEEFEYGFVYRRILEGQSESDELWTVGRTCLWPNCLFTGGHFEWRVPIDDENMLSVGWFFDRIPNEMEPFTQERIPYWYSPITEARTGRWITTHVMNQDFVAW